MLDYRYKSKKILLVALIMFGCFASFAIVYATLFVTLDIGFGKVRQNALTWNIGFLGSSVKGTFSGTSEVGASCGNATITSSSIVVEETSLSKPGDKCTYPVKIYNNGEIPGYLSNIFATEPDGVTCNKSAPSTMVCGNITYKLTAKDDTTLTTGVIINSHEAYNIKLVAEYTGADLSTEEVIHDNVKFVLTYSQSNERTSNGPEAPIGIDQPKCRRAKTLHTETCYLSSGGCYENGYYLNGSKASSTITYGSLGTSGVLTPGDAFDCDVNGDGDFDPATERFYYVSGKDGDDTSEYKTLIYYTNVSGGVANNTTTFAYNANSNYLEGPVTAYEQLPSITQWSNIELSSQYHQIYNTNGLTNKAGSSYANFYYSNKAARLLDYREINKTCNINVGNRVSGELDKCEFLLESTTFSSNSFVDYWIESAYTSNNNNIYVYGKNRKADYNSTSAKLGVRPVIEVADVDISY